MKKTLLLIFCTLYLVMPAFGENIPKQENLHTQKITIKNSYLSAVITDKNEAYKQEVIVSNSFLVFIKVKACSDNSTLQNASK